MNILLIFLIFILGAENALADEKRLEVPAVESQRTIKQKFTHILISETVYYLSGPQQDMPPEGRFKVGQKVTLIENAGSYSYVESDDGITAYISTGSLQELGSEHE